MGYVTAEMTAYRPQAETDNGRTLIVGLGQSGLSCVRFLSARGERVVIIDSRANPPGLAALREELPDVAVVTGGFDPQIFARADRLVVSPGVAVREPLIREARERGAEILGDIELFAREAKAPIVAITGSNGKSTVTTLVGEMARHAGRKVAVGGNLGPAALELLDDEVELYVLELSSFQLETTCSLKPRVAVVLNVSADHLDRYPDLQSYAEVKAGIYQGAELRVFNRDDPLVAAMAERRKGDRFFTLQTPGTDEFGLIQDGEGLWLCRGSQRLLAADQLAIPGRHNLANALAALALGSALELPIPAMLEALRSYHGLPHRTQFVAEHEGVRWYNDSKATNLGACIAALKGFAGEPVGQTVLIAGGDGKGADFSALAEAMDESVRAVVLIGRDACQIESALKGRVSTVLATDMEEAVAQAAEIARPGDRVLLSPACASLDMFDNFAQRGEVFMAAVRGMSS
jgi:UDP-N-acetylmuramoylalanine--D-glutamate ligase